MVPACCQNMKIFVHLFWNRLCQKYTIFLFAAYVQTVTNVKDAIVTRLTMKETCKTEKKKKKSLKIVIKTKENLKINWEIKKNENKT